MPDPLPPLADNWTCAKCQHVNPVQAQQCQQCGADAPPTTISISIPHPSVRTAPFDRTPSPAAAPDPALPPDLSPGALALCLKGHAAPLVVEADTRAILGRKSDKPVQAPLLDLTDYDAYRHGVSRQHAQVTVFSGRAVIQDMGSANGTWLNERRLVPFRSYPLHNGDQVMLGRLSLTVLISGPVDATASSQEATPPKTGEQTDSDAAPGE